MVKRAKQHRLEDISLTAFKAVILPMGWVVREKNQQNDYGIDAEIEIFDEEGNATGLMFFAQLKATENSDEASVQKISFDIDKIKYYKSLVLPVLIVRYSEKTKKFYCKWNHDVDLYYARKGAKTIRINFSKEEIWDDKFAVETVNFLKKLRSLKYVPINFPINVHVESKDDFIGSIPSAVFLTSYKMASNSLFEEIVKFENDKNRALCNIKFDDKDAIIQLSSVSGCVIHDITKGNMDNSAINVVMGIATSLARFGQTEIAARILMHEKVRLKFVQNSELFYHNIGFIINTSKHEEIINSVCEVMEEPDSNNLLELVTVMSVICDKAISSSSNNKLYKLLNKCLEKALHTGDGAFIGSSYYNLGNHFHAKRLHKEAVNSYLKARKFHQKYLEFYYYYQELAASLFLLGKYKFAANFYKIALEKGAPETTKPLLADALMFSGRYKLAHDVFEDYLSKVEKNDNAHDEWRLKNITLENLITHTGVHEQVRRKSEANEKIQKINCLETTPALLVEKLLKVLELDSMNSCVWFNLGIAYNSTGKQEDACFSFLMASLMNLQDIESWTNAALLSFLTSPNLFQTILNVAYHHNREAFLVEFYKQLSLAIKDKNLLTKAANTIDQILKKINEKEVSKNPQLRLMNKDGIFEDILQKIEK